MKNFNYKGLRDGLGIDPGDIAPDILGTNLLDGEYTTQQKNKINIKQSVQELISYLKADGLSGAPKNVGTTRSGTVSYHAAAFHRTGVKYCRIQFKWTKYESWARVWDCIFGPPDKRFISTQNGLIDLVKQHFDFRNSDLQKSGNIISAKTFIESAGLVVHMRLSCEIPEDDDLKELGACMDAYATLDLQVHKVSRTDKEHLQWMLSREVWWPGFSEMIDWKGVSCEASTCARCYRAIAL